MPWRPNPPLASTAAAPAETQPAGAPDRESRAENAAREEEESRVEERAQGYPEPSSARQGTLLELLRDTGRCRADAEGDGSFEGMSVLGRDGVPADTVGPPA